MIKRLKRWLKAWRAAITRADEGGDVNDRTTGW